MKPHVDCQYRFCQKAPEPERQSQMSHSLPSHSAPLPAHEAGQNAVKADSDAYFPPLQTGSQVTAEVDGMLTKLAQQNGSSLSASFRLQFNTCWDCRVMFVLVAAKHHMALKPVQLGSESVAALRVCVK